MRTILIDPHPCRHIVYPYTDEERALNAVALFAGSGIAKDEAVILIMAEKRKRPIFQRLTESGTDAAWAQATGQLQCVNAAALLERFISRGSLEEDLVKDTIRAIVARARKKSPVRKVRVFGEMVSILLAQDKVDLAERLEQLWNEIIEAESISLLCSYTLVDAHLTSLPECLTLLHSHTLADTEETTRECPGDVPRSFLPSARVLAPIESGS